MASVKHAALLLAVAAVLLPSSHACSCLRATYKQHFDAAKSVHRVKVLRAYPAVGSVQQYKVQLEKDYKGCGKRPAYFKVQDTSFGTSCINTLTVGKSYLLHLDSAPIPSLGSCSGNSEFGANLPKAILSFLRANDQCPYD
jgi:hypothetical protein